MNLYDIGREWQELEQALIESGGELTEELEERLGQLMVAEDDKIDGYIMVRANLKMLAEGAMAEGRRLIDKAKAAESAISRMEEALAQHMEIRGIEKIERPLGKVRLQYVSKQPVEVLSDDLPDDYVTVKVVRSPDKKHLFECLTSEIDEVKQQAEQYAKLGAKSRFIRIY